MSENATIPTWEQLRWMLQLLGAIVAFVITPLVIRTNKRVDKISNGGFDERLIPKLDKVREEALGGIQALQTHRDKLMEQQNTEIGRLEARIRFLEQYLMTTNTNRATPTTKEN